VPEQNYAAVIRQSRLHAVRPSGCKHGAFREARDAPAGTFMADSQLTDNASSRRAVSTSDRLRRWVYPILRIAFLAFVAWLIWYTAGHWDRWTGAARFESTDDAFVAGDVTPLSARVSGYITEMPVNDFQTTRKGDLIAVCSNPLRISCAPGSMTAPA
jgi:hypothetical protein